jgi:hypothetical protein
VCLPAEQWGAPTKQVSERHLHLLLLLLLQHQAPCQTQQQPLQAEPHISSSNHTQHKSLGFYCLTYYTLTVAPTGCTASSWHWQTTAEHTPCVSW